MINAILFVCTGNICRSPMAEYMLRDRLGRDSGWIVGSAGIVAGRGMMASAAAVTALKEIGIDLTPHRSRRIDQDLVDEAELVVVMTASHRDQLRCLFPDDFDKVYLLKSFAGGRNNGDIEDPIGLDIAAYRAVRKEIDGSLPGLMEYMMQITARRNEA